MPVESCFEVQEDEIEGICDLIAARLPEADRLAARERALRIARSFEGRDADALSVLKYAAERGKFEEYAKRLENFYDRDISFVHPEDRKLVINADLFFIACYREMGIKPRER